MWSHLGHGWVSLISISLVFLFAGCSTDPVVKSHDDVNFEDLSGHWTGPHVYELGQVLETDDINLAFKAARAGLLHAGYEIIESDESQYRVSGKRDSPPPAPLILPPLVVVPLPLGPDNAVAASVYLKEKSSSVVAKVVFTLHDYALTKNDDGYEQNEAIHRNINTIFSGMKAFIVDEEIRLQKLRREQDGES